MQNKRAIARSVSTFLFGTLACAFAQNALAGVDCSGLTLNNYKIYSMSSGTIKKNYNFSGICSLPLTVAGQTVSIPVPTTIDAEVTDLSLKSALVAESIKFTYGGKTSTLTSMATCTTDPIFDPSGMAQCSSKHLTGAPPVGQVTENDIVLSHGRGGTAQKIVLDKLEADKKLWYYTPTTTPQILSPTPGEVVNPKALKIQVKLPTPRPPWQACCDVYISFKADNGWNGISKNLKIDASMAEGNTIYVDLASLLTEAQKTVLAGQNMNHADMQLTVVDTVNPNAKIDNDESKVPQHNSQQQSVDFKLPRLSLGLGGPAKPAAAPKNPYKSKPVVASPSPGTSYSGDVFVRAQKLAKELTDDGYQCCTLTLERKANGVWGGFSMGAMAVKTDLDSAGTTLSIPESGDFRIKLTTVSYNNSAFAQESDWVEFKFNKAAPPAPGNGKAPGAKSSTGAGTPDTPKPPLVFVPVVPVKK